MLRTRTTAFDSGFGLVVVAALLWGTLGTAGSEISRTSGMSSAEISSIRLVIGGVILLTIAMWSGELRRVQWTRAATSRVAITSVLTAIYAIAFLEAIEHLGVASGTVVTLGVGPILVLLEAILGGRGRPLGSAIVGSIMSIVGLVLVCGPEALLLGADSRSVVGAAYALICGIGFAAMTAVNRRPIEHLGPITLVGLTFCGSGLLAISAVALESTGDVRLTQASIVWILFISIVPTALGYVAYFAGLARGVPASSALISTLLELVSAASLAVLLLHESIGTMTAAGSALIIGAAVVMRPKTNG